MDKLKRKVEDSVTKRLETTKEIDEGDESNPFRDMLFEVGENLASQHVDAIADLAELSVREKDEIRSHTGNKSLYLFRILEEKRKISPDDVLWLHNNLIKIHNKMAAKIVSNYLSGPDETLDFPNEPESSSSDGSDECSSFQDFLSRIGLQENFPCKLGLKVLLTVKEVQENQGYIESFWQKLTSLDYRAGLPCHSLSNRFSMRDFIFGVLHCSDDFVRQDILEKMSACQLAVPIVLNEIDGVPITFLLWALRRVSKKWKGPLDSLSIEQPVVSYPVFTVAVLRIGDVKISKSQVLNTMLSCSQGNTLHSYFLTEEKDIIKPKFSKGTIECAWFLPMYGNDKEIFKDVIAFFNLRGDCRNYPVQTKFACRFSNYTIVFIDTDKREENVKFVREIKASSRHFLFVTIKKDGTGKTKSQKVHHPKYDNCWLFVKVLHMDVLSKKICDMIVHTMDKENKERYTCLKDLSKIAGEILNVDEHKKVCTNAQQFVADLFKSASVDNILEFKKCCFPLQGIWKELVSIEKERFDSDNEKHASFEHQREHVLTQKRSKRESQLKTSLSETMKKYFNMIKAGNDDNTALLHYILGFLQDRIYHVVNENTKGDMDKILQLEKVIRKRQTAVSDLSSSESPSDFRSEIEIRTDLTYQEMLKECSKLYKQCRAKNLGSEHFLRELGQLYEAFKDIKEPQLCTNVHSAEIILLPELAASLVNEMQSLEILDGDTGSVPMTWVTSVLDSLTRKLGNPKVLVLSVIGVQSSGKSTFLNSMFGVRFPVRAGRCTRGLFIRFLQMEGNLAQELECEYLIVVDTEGIRSLDHDDQRFDNELVTLALSIANVTIFNIEGENIGPDMTGILQIAAHALMRMKEVDLECHCRIVQQRVSDLTAGDRNKANTNRIMETLDHATKIAAEEEGLEGRYQFFADVVDLKVDENFQYIPCLWTGGMSPPNHMYSETVGKVKSQLFEDIKEKSIVSDFTLSTFTQRIIDVWKAIKEEDFVFNFRDSVRAVDFNQFCLEYNKWIAEMRLNMAECTDRILTRIEYEMDEDNSDSDDENSNEIDIEALKELVRSSVEREREKLKQSVHQYISKHERRTTIQRYKNLYLEEINILLKDVENQSCATLTDEYELRKLQLTSNLTKFKRKWRRRLSYEAKKAAISLEADDDTTHEDLISRFLSHWEKWTEMINKECARGRPKSKTTLSSLTIVCEKLLLRITRDMAVGSEIRKLMDLEGGIDKHDDLPLDCSKYIHTKFVKAWIRHKSLAMKQNEGHQRKETEEKLIENERMRAASHVQRLIQSAFVDMVEKQSGKPFDGNIYQLVIQNSLEELSGKHDHFKPPQTLIAKGLLCIAGSTLPFLFGNELKYGSNISALFEEEKQCILEDFLAFSTGNDLALRAAQYIYFYIESPVKEKFEKEFTRQKYAMEIASLKRRVLTTWDALFSIVETSGSTFDLFEQLFFEPFTSLCEYFAEKRNVQQKWIQMKKDRANTLVLELIQVIEKCEGETHTGTLTEWSSMLAGNFECDFITAVGELFEMNDIASVSTQLKHILRNTLHNVLIGMVVSNWDLNSYPFYFTAGGNEFFCHHACPLCGAPCDNRFVYRHGNHFSYLHRPRGFKGETNPDTNKLVIEDCSSSILDRLSTFRFKEQTHFCHQYKKFFPDWDIRPSVDDPGKVFWQWLFVMFNNYIALLYECSPADIPHSWHSITKEQALTSLKEDKQLKTLERTFLFQDDDL